MNDRPGVLPGAPILVALIIAAAALPGRGTAAGADDRAFTEVMRRAHGYTVIYEDHELSTVMGREIYQQQWLDAAGQTKAERSLTSDYLLFQLPPSEDWFAFRDVHNVDGMPVGDRADRLKQLFTGPGEPQGDRAMEIMKESGRFNLAPDLYFRTVNVPTFALRFLRPASRSRVVFTKAGEEPVGNTPAWVVEYRETKGPTFVATPERRDLPAHGRFWIAPDTGAVLRSEMIVGGSRRMPAQVTITVTYKHEPSLGFHVPVEMLERYDNPRRPLQDDVVVARATYSEFRRFDWRTLVPPPTER
jgi:hypothetical protein